MFFPSVVEQINEHYGETLDLGGYESYSFRSIKTPSSGLTPIRGQGVIDGRGQFNEDKYFILNFTCTEKKVKDFVFLYHMASVFGLVPVKSYELCNKIYSGYIKYLKDDIFFNVLSPAFNSYGIFNDKVSSSFMELERNMNGNFFVMLRKMSIKSIAGQTNSFSISLELAPVYDSVDMVMANPTFFDDYTTNLEEKMPVIFGLYEKVLGKSISSDFQGDLNFSSVLKNALYNTENIPGTAVKAVSEISPYVEIDSKFISGVELTLVNNIVELPLQGYKPAFQHLGKGEAAVTINLDFRRNHCDDPKAQSYLNEDDFYRDEFLNVVRGMKTMTRMNHKTYFIGCNYWLFDFFNLTNFYLQAEGENDFESDTSQVSSMSLFFLANAYDRESLQFNVEKSKQIMSLDDLGSQIPFAIYGYYQEKINSLYNELTAKKITEEFKKKTLSELESLKRTLTLLVGESLTNQMYDFAKTASSFVGVNSDSFDTQYRDYAQVKTGSNGGLRTGVDYVLNEFNYAFSMYNLLYAYATNPSNLIDFSNKEFVNKIHTVARHFSASTGLINYTEEDLASGDKDKIRKAVFFDYYSALFYEMIVDNLKGTYRSLYKLGQFASFTVSTKYTEAPYSVYFNEAYSYFKNNYNNITSDEESVFELFSKTYGKAYQNPAMKILFDSNFFYAMFNTIDGSDVTITASSTNSYGFHSKFLSLAKEFSTNISEFLLIPGSISEMIKTDKTGFLKKYENELETFAKASYFKSSDFDLPSTDFDVVVNSISYKDNKKIDGGSSSFWGDNGHPSDIIISSLKLNGKLNYGLDSIKDAFDSAINTVSNDANFGFVNGEYNDFLTKMGIINTPWFKTKVNRDSILSEKKEEFFKQLKKLDNIFTVSVINFMPVIYLEFNNVNTAYSYDTGTGFVTLESQGFSNKIIDVSTYTDLETKIKVAKIKILDVEAIVKTFSAKEQNQLTVVSDDELYDYNSRSFPIIVGSKIVLSTGSSKKTLKSLFTGTVESITVDSLNNVLTLECSSYAKNLYTGEYSGVFGVGAKGLDALFSVDSWQVDVLDKIAEKLQSIFGSNFMPNYQGYNDTFYDNLSKLITSGSNERGSTFDGILSRRYSRKTFNSTELKNEFFQTTSYFLLAHVLGQGALDYLEDFNMNTKKTTYFTRNQKTKSFSDKVTSQTKMCAFEGSILKNIYPVDFDFRHYGTDEKGVHQSSTWTPIIPTASDDSKKLAEGFNFKDKRTDLDGIAYTYKFKKYTFAQILNEMEARYPGVVWDVLEDGRGATLFFGKTEQMVHRYLSPYSENKVTYSNFISKFQENSIANSFSTTSNNFSFGGFETFVKNYKNKKNDYQKGIVKLETASVAASLDEEKYRNKVIGVSGVNLISCTISTNYNLGNTAHVDYDYSWLAEFLVDLKKNVKQFLGEESEVGTVVVPSLITLPDELKKPIQNGKNSIENINSEYQAYEYGMKMLEKEMINFYDGKIVLVHDPSIKVGSEIIVSDPYNNIFGAMVCKQVEHVISATNGFITIVTPGMKVNYEESSSALLDFFGSYNSLVTTLNSQIGSFTNLKGFKGTSVATDVFAPTNLPVTLSPGFLGVYNKIQDDSNGKVKGIKNSYSYRLPASQNFGLCGTLHPVYAKGQVLTPFPDILSLYSPGFSHSIGVITKILNNVNNITDKFTKWSLTVPTRVSKYLSNVTEALENSFAAQEKAVAKLNAEYDLSYFAEDTNPQKFTSNSNATLVFDAGHNPADWFANENQRWSPTFKGDTNNPVFQEYLKECSRILNDENALKGALDVTEYEFEKGKRKTPENERDKNKEPTLREILDKKHQNGYVSEFMMNYIVGEKLEKKLREANVNYVFFNSNAAYKESGEGKQSLWERIKTWGFFKSENEAGITTRARTMKRWLDRRGVLPANAYLISIHHNAGGSETVKTVPTLDSFLKKKGKSGSAFMGKEKAIKKLCFSYNVDYPTFIAILMNETAWGSSNACLKFNNPAGIMINDELKTFKTLEEGLSYSVKNLSKYYADGLETIEELGGRYAPIGVKNDPKGLNKNWVPNVTRIRDEFLTHMSSSSNKSGFFADKKPNANAKNFTDFLNSGYASYLSGLGLNAAASKNDTAEIGALTSLKETSDFAGVTYYEFSCYDQKIGVELSVTDVSVDIMFNYLLEKIFNGGTTDRYTKDLNERRDMLINLYSKKYRYTGKYVYNPWFGLYGETSTLNLMKLFKFEALSVISRMSVIPTNVKTINNEPGVIKSYTVANKTVTTPPVLQRLLNYKSFNGYDLKKYFIINVMNLNSKIIALNGVKKDSNEKVVNSVYEPIFKNVEELNKELNNDFRFIPAVGAENATGTVSDILNSYQSFAVSSWNLETCDYNYQTILNNEGAYSRISKSKGAEKESWTKMFKNTSVNAQRSFTAMMEKLFGVANMAFYSKVSFASEIHFLYASNRYNEDVESSFILFARQYVWSVLNSLIKNVNESNFTSTNSVPIENIQLIRLRKMEYGDVVDPQTKKKISTVKIEYGMLIFNTSTLYSEIAKVSVHPYTFYKTDSSGNNLKEATTSNAVLVEPNGNQPHFISVPEWGKDHFSFNYMFFHTPDIAGTDKAEEQMYKNLFNAIKGIPLDENILKKSILLGDFNANYSKRKGEYVAAFDEDSKKEKSVIRIGDVEFFEPIGFNAFSSFYSTSTSDYARQNDHILISEKYASDFKNEQFMASEGHMKYKNSYNDKLYKYSNHPILHLKDFKF